jgi:hypothetical protein
VKQLKKIGHGKLITELCLENRDNSCLLSKVGKKCLLKKIKDIHLPLKKRHKTFRTTRCKNNMNSTRFGWSQVSDGVVYMDISWGRYRVVESEKGPRIFGKDS